MPIHLRVEGREDIPMSRFDDEGAPLITRTVTDRWNLPIALVQRILQLQPTLRRAKWEAIQKRRAAGQHAQPESEPQDLSVPPEAYGEHGERLHVHEEEVPPAAHIDLEG